MLARAQTTAVVTRNASLRSTPSSALTLIRLLVPNEALTLVTTAQVNGYYHVRTRRAKRGGCIARSSLARDEGSESVNCAAATDIHTNLGPKSAHPVEHDGIVAETIPQLPRPTGWN